MAVPTTTGAGGLFSNVDAAGRLTPQELYAAGAHDANLGMIEQATHVANLRRLARDHRATIVGAYTQGIAVVQDGEERAFTHITPEWILQLTLRDLMELDRAPVAAWISDRAWPWKMRPSFDNDAVWQAVFDGRVCVRCARVHHEDSWPANCPACALPVTTARKALELIEDRLKIASGDFTPEVHNPAGAVPVLS